MFHICMNTASFVFHILHKYRTISVCVHSPTLLSAAAMALLVFTSDAAELASTVSRL